MKTIKQLLEQAENDTLFMFIQKKYPEEEERVKSGYYENLIKKLKNAKEEPNESERTIHVEYSKDFGESNPNYVWNASYSTEKRYHCKYSLKFITFEEIASSFVRNEDLEKLSKEEYLAHLLYELAYRDILMDDEVKLVSVQSKPQKDYFRVEDVIEDEMNEE